MKLLLNKWLWLILIILGIGFWFNLRHPGMLYDPTWFNQLTDKSHIYVKEILDYNYRIYAVMLDEIRDNLNTFYLIIITGFAILIVITIQIIAAITRLPIGYLAYPGKFLVIKNSNEAQNLKEKGESK
jgi:hypothetical protein